MADALARTHPLQSRSVSFEDLSGAVRIEVEPFVAMADVHLAPARTELPTLLGVAPPTVPNTWVPAPAGRIIWLGPSEWLVTEEGARPEDLEAELRRTVTASSGAVADVSAQRISLRVHGAAARHVLAKGCSLDLHPRVFRTGCCAQTTLGRAGVVILALSDTADDFQLLVRSSFARYLAEWLLDAAHEFAPVAQ